MNIYLLGLIVPTLSFCLLIWPRIIKRYFGIDTWRWMFFADYVRKHKKLPEESSDKRYVVNSVYGYPPVLIYFLSFFPKKFLEKYQFIFSPSFDFINNFLVFFVSLKISGDIKTAIIAQIIAALVPIVTTEASNLNTRILSMLIFNVSFSTLILFTITHQSPWLAISAITLFILFFTHRFGTQTYLVSIIGFTIMEQNIFYTLYFTLIFGLVYLIGGKLYKAILNEHIACLKFWVGQTDDRFAHQIKGLINKTKREDFVQRAYRLSFENPILFALATNPWSALLMLLVINYSFSLISLSSSLTPNYISKLVIWGGTLFVWGVLVLSIKWLKNFGDGQRYLGYSVIPTALIIASFVSPLINQYGLISYFGFSIIALSMLCLIIFLQYKTVILDRPRSITKGVWDVIKYINTHNPTKITLAMFPQQMGDALLYFTKCKILTSDTLIGLKELADFYPILRKPMNEIIKKYKITHIYFDRNYVELKELKLKNYKILIDSDNYVLLKVE